MKTLVVTEGDGKTNNLYNDINIKINPVASKTMDIIFHSA